MYILVAHVGAAHACAAISRLLFYISFLAAWVCKARKYLRILKKGRRRRERKKKRSVATQVTEEKGTVLPEESREGAEGRKSIPAPSSLSLRLESARPRSSEAGRSVKKKKTCWQQVPTPSGPNGDCFIYTHQFHNVLSPTLIRPLSPASARSIQFTTIGGQCVYVSFFRGREPLNL